MRKRKPITLDSFPSEFFNVWEVAAAGKLSLPFDSTGKAKNFIQRLNTFRKLLNEANPDLAAKFYFYDLKSDPQPGGKALIVSYIPEWKKEAREAAARLQPQIILPPEIPAISADEPSLPLIDNMEESLKHLGFSTKIDGVK